MSVSVFGWTLSATQNAMMARSGNMQSVPMTPVNVRRGVPVPSAVSSDLLAAARSSSLARDLAV
jgi:hypothetical protein